MRIAKVMIRGKREGKNGKYYLQPTRTFLDSEMISQV